MAKTLSNMVTLGTIAPDFYLENTCNPGHFLSFNDSKGDRGTVVLFICNHCPFVHHVIAEVIAIRNNYLAQGIELIAISSNDSVQYPLDSPECMTAFARNNNFDFPYFYDATQEVAIAYDAACTPDFFLFDSQNKLVYRGQLDSSRPANGIEVTGSDLRDAIECIIDNRPITAIQKPSLGCNIKWKAEKNN